MAKKRNLHVVIKWLQFHQGALKHCLKVMDAGLRESGGDQEIRKYF